MDMPRVAVANAPLIEVRDVSVRFGGIVALDKVSFTIACLLYTSDAADD